MLIGGGILHGGQAADFRMVPVAWSLLAQSEYYETGTWPDLSGNARHLTEVSDPPARATPAGYNGWPAVQFNAATPNILKSPSFAISQPVSYLFVGEPTLANAALKDCVIGRTSGGSDSARLFWDASEVISYSAGTNRTGSSGNVPTVAILTFNGASSELMVNGSAESTANPGAAGVLNGITLGVDDGGTARPWGGYMLAVGVYDGVFTTAQKAIINQIAVERYGIA